MNLLNTNICECGVKLCGKHIKPPLLNMAEIGIKDKNFYGGRVKKAANAKCECGKEYVLFLKPISNGYDVIDMSPKFEVEIDVDKMDRKQLLAKAKELKIPGKIATIKADELKDKIKSEISKV